jgi:hypothetical protein
MRKYTQRTIKAFCYFIFPCYFQHSPCLACVSRYLFHIKYPEHSHSPLYFNILFFSFSYSRLLCVFSCFSDVLFLWTERHNIGPGSKIYHDFFFVVYRWLQCAYMPWWHSQKSMKSCYRRSIIMKTTKDERWEMRMDKKRREKYGKRLKFVIFFLAPSVCKINKWGEKLINIFHS